MRPPTPYPANVNGFSVELFRNHEDREAYIEANPDADRFALRLVANAMFHNLRDHEYIAATFFDEQGEELWTRDFERRDLMIWMGGVALDSEDQHILHLANRELGSFADQYGWRPDTIIEWEPNLSERESYIQYALRDLAATDGMPIEFFEGDAD